MFLNTLTGRFLVLTVIFVMLAEVLIFVPSVARFREDYLLARLERAQIASLALLASRDEMIDPALEAELLANAGVLNVVLRRDAVRELMLSSPMPAPIDATFDLRYATPPVLIRDALWRLVDPRERIIRVIGDPLREAGLLIEVTMPSAPLRTEMIDYGLRILLMSAVISIVTAMMLFLAVRRFVVAPISRVISHIKAYEAAPEDARQIITPTASIIELREAEQALQSMQTQLSAALRQKDRLATLGGAVARISHDLRNMLTTAQLLADRIEQSEDPGVKRLAPRLLGSLDRAVRLCETTLAFGRAEELAPVLAEVALARLVDDVLEAEQLAAEAEGRPDLTELRHEVPPGLRLHADAEQLFRVLSNLARNARQAIEASGTPGRVTISAEDGADDVTIRVTDTGPGLPAKVRETVFRAFGPSSRKGGSGLGLAIAAELVRGHGGRLELAASDGQGTEFIIRLPKARASLAAQ